MSTKEIATTFGRIIISPVPAYVQSHLYKIANYPAVPVEVVTGLGGTEATPARPGTPEYDQYLEAMREADERRQLLTLAAAVGLGIKRWQFANGDFQDEPPDGWEIPEEYRSISLTELLKPVPPLSSAVLRRADYLLLNVLGNPADLQAAITTAMGGVTEADVSSAEQIFRG